MNAIDKADFLPTRYVRVRLSTREKAWIKDPRAGRMLNRDVLIGTRVNKNGDLMDQVVVTTVDSVVGEYRMSRTYGMLERIDVRM